MTAARLAVLASGGGSNLQALIDAHSRGDLSTPIALVVSNSSKAGALERARRHGIPTAHISSNTHVDPGAAWFRVFDTHKIDVLVLAGYMKLVDPRIIERFRDRIINIHPAPLPEFGGAGMYGARAHEAVLRSNAETSGPTVHLVNERYDEGAILAHLPVPVEPGDSVESLSARVLRAEHNLFWKIIEREFGSDSDWRTRTQTQRRV